MSNKMQNEKTIKDNVGYNKQFTSEVKNIPGLSDVNSDSFDFNLLDYIEEGDFWGLLSTLSDSLIVTREYEHFAVALDGVDGKAWQSPLPLPHPSGMFYDESAKELLISSTRTPNIIMSYNLADKDKLNASEILPEDVTSFEGNLFLPKKALYLPGSLYIHDLVKIDQEMYATITGHNMLAKLNFDGGWERVWSPNILNQLEPKQRYRQNFLQLNSIGIGVNGLKDSYCTGFSDLVTGKKPWKDGYGPKGKGVVYSVETGEVIYRGLTCPHSAKIHNGKLWVCNSGYGEVGYIENFESNDISQTKFVPVFKMPGFTRGLSFVGDYVFVGLSKIIDKYGPYAPGLVPAESRCGIWVFNVHNGEKVAYLDWVNGYQIYDIQILKNVAQPLLPLGKDKDGINHLLRYYG